MSADAHSQFIDGQRVTAQHLQHLQDRLREGIADIRSCIGLGKVAWGLRAELMADQVMVRPGAAFAQSDVRLVLEDDATVALPASGAPWHVVLHGMNEEVTALNHNDIPTLITLVTQLSIISGDAVSDTDSLVIATVDNSGGTNTLTQDSETFAATGHHNHRGEWLQNSLGQWLYDGPEVAGAGVPGPPGEQGAKGPKGAKGTKGEPGADGLTGPAGQQGLQGAQGPQGPQGQAGETGPAGSRGEPGLIGETGLPGARGSRGAKGAPGAVGPRGATGPAGETTDWSATARWRATTKRRP